MLTLPSEKIRVWYSDEHGWIADVVQALSHSMLRGVAAHVLTVQQKRLRSLLPGDRRDECLRTIARLQREGVRQRVLASRDGIVAFASTEAIGDKSFHFFGGASNG